MFWKRSCTSVLSSVIYRRRHAGVAAAAAAAAALANLFFKDVDLQLELGVAHCRTPLTDRPTDRPTAAAAAVSDAPVLRRATISFRPCSPSLITHTNSSDDDDDGRGA